ncbi:hypothetical protein HYC85_000854 [Camellia sinensis]|uniref:Hydroxyproline O-arabinosyltransferase-like domain-containing protein n=1 Tax=Camellia sinensis TaxID=4442 RepID=A0A7J7I4D5_CAMSI|nr:hypothetical protein HYC85_000854 [Camellia sinensis]
MWMVLSFYLIPMIYFPFVGLKSVGYIVLNRPWAFVQWLEKATIEEEYILMAEPDHIFVNPLPNLAHGGLSAGFPFFYIKPKEHEKIVRKFFAKENGPVTNIDPIGNSPVIIKKDTLEKIAPTWMNISLRMKDDPETDKTFGWVCLCCGLGFAWCAAYTLKRLYDIGFEPCTPPWDLETGKFFIIHYTYGCDYNMKFKLITSVSRVVILNRSSVSPKDNLRIHSIAKALAFTDSSHFLDDVTLECYFIQ